MPVRGSLKRERSTRGPESQVIDVGGVGPSTGVRRKSESGHSRDTNPTPVDDAGGTSGGSVQRSGNGHDRGHVTRWGWGVDVEETGDLRMDPVPSDDETSSTVGTTLWTGVVYRGTYYARLSTMVPATRVGHLVDGPFLTTHTANRGMRIFRPLPVHSASESISFPV